MSDKIEALEALKDAEIALSFALAAGDHMQCRVDVKKAQEAHNALRASLEQKAEPVAWLPERLTREQAEPFCELMGCKDGRCDCYRDCDGNVDLQEAWQETRRLILSTTPPSTAEVEARALEAYAQRMDEAGVITSLDDQMVTRLLDEAKRIREQSND